jgi:hypothetical protein
MWDFWATKNEIIKLPRLLRHARRLLPELSLLLDQIDPFDFCFLRKLRLSAQSDGVALRKIRTPTEKYRTRRRNEK